MKITPVYGYSKKDSHFWYRIARRGGGVFFGIRLHFPVSIWDGPADEPGHIPTNTRYRSIYLDIGLIFWEFRCHIDYGHKPL